MKEGERKSRIEYLMAQKHIRKESIKGPFELGPWKILPRERSEGSGLLMETEGMKIGLALDPERSAKADWIHYSPYLMKIPEEKLAGFSIINSYIKKGAVSFNLKKKSLKVWDQEWMSIK